MSIPFIISTLGGAPEPEIWHFDLIYQSNGVPITEPEGNSNTEVYPEGTLQLGRTAPNNNVLIPATVPLDHNSGFLGSNYGPGWTTRFANLLVADNPHVRLLFNPCCDPGTGFANDKWNKDDVNYLDWKDRHNFIRTNYPNTIFKGVLSDGGEAERNDAGNFITKFTQFNSDWRNDLIGADSTTPYVCLGLLPAFIDSNAGVAQVDSDLRTIPSFVPYSAYVDSRDPYDIPGYDGVHRTSTGSLEMGNRVYPGYLSALTNTP